MIDLFEKAVPVLIEGFWVTLRIGLFSILFASLLGLGAALMRTARHPLDRVPPSPTAPSFAARRC